MELGERLVFALDSDKKSIILVSSDGEIKYASEGMYGGYLLKPPIDLNGIKAYFVEPSTSKIEKAEEKNKLKNEYIAQHIKNIAELNEFFSNDDDYGAEVVKYRVIEVRVIEKKRTDRYIVLDFDPLPNGEKHEAEAIRFYYSFVGSRRHPKYHTAGRIVKELKLKYPENEFIQRHVYGKPIDDRSSAIFIKIVTKAPEINPPACEDLASINEGEISYLEKQINELRELVKQKEEELNNLKEKLQMLELKLRIGKMKSRLVDLEIPEQ